MREREYFFNLFFFEIKCTFFPLTLFPASSIQIQVKTKKNALFARRAYALLNLSSYIRKTFSFQYDN